MIPKCRVTAYDPDNKPLKVLTCGRIDASSKITHLTESWSDPNVIDHNIYVVEKIARISVIEGLLTLYYESGHFLEIQKIYS